MKRVITSFLILTLLLFCAACGAKQDTQQTEATDLPTPTYDESAAAQDDEGGEEFSQIAIGFSMAGQGAFYEQLISDIESECTDLNYRPEIKTATTAQQQIEHLHTMLSTGVSVIVLDPVDVDALEAVLAECETNNVPVINIIDSINGLVSTLIAPDYISIGNSAGRDANELYGESTGACMLLKTDFDSFTMQLMTDGFVDTIGEDKDVSLVSEQFCGDDEETAFSVTKAELDKPDSTINFIFAQSDALGRGALRAIEESGKEVSLTVFGGDMTLVEAAVQGNVRACIFFGTTALAKDTLSIADKFIKNDGYSPKQFIELRIEAAQGDGASQYVVDGAKYAQIIG